AGIHGKALRDMNIVLHVSTPNPLALMVRRVSNSRIGDQTRWGIGKKGRKTGERRPTTDEPSWPFAVVLSSINCHSKFYGMDPFGPKRVVVPLEVIPNRLSGLPQSQPTLKCRKRSAARSAPNRNPADG